MSFLRPRRQSLLDKAIRFRGELLAFLGLATLWGVMLNLLASALWEFGVSCALKQINNVLPAWSHWPLALVAILATVAVALWLLANALASSLEEIRRFTVVVPVFATQQDLQLLAVERYYGSKTIMETFQSTANGTNLMDLYRGYRADADLKGRPFQGELYDRFARVLPLAMITSLRRANDFFLGVNGLYHGVEYFSGHDAVDTEVVLREPRMLPLSSKLAPIPLPPGCTVAVEADKQERHGKSIPRVVITFPRGQVVIRFHSQYSLMSDGYHGRSLRVLRGQIKPPTSLFSINGDAPSLWPMEFACSIRVHFRTSGFTILNEDIEDYASWIDDLVERLEDTWSWEAYIEINGLGNN